jgi:hypothetical protein
MLKRWDVVCQPPNTLARVVSDRDFSLAALCLGLCLGLGQVRDEYLKKLVFTADGHPDLIGDSESESSRGGARGQVGERLISAYVCNPVHPQSLQQRCLPYAHVVTGGSVGLVGLVGAVSSRRSCR